MLTFEQPAREIDGVLLYADHAVPTQFYYAAPNPNLVRKNNTPMFDLYMYTVALEQSVLSGTKIPEELGAGFLNMGVECVLSETTLRRVRSQLAGQLNVLETDLLLAPIPYADGTVSVIALDEMQSLSGEPGAADSNDRLTNRPKFVEKIVGSQKPSLLGDLRTIFSLSLSQEGAVFLSELYGQNASPVGVVYALEFYGLSPAVDVKIQANLSRIHKHFGGSIGGQYAWFKAEVEAGIDFLVENSAIDIEMISQLPTEAAQKSKQLALDLFKERIVQEMFKPSAANARQTASSIASGVSSGVRNALSGESAAASATGALTLALKANLKYEDKKIVYHFNERLPVKRTHAPQAFLPLLISEQTLQDRIHLVSLDSPFFQTVEVLATGPTPKAFSEMGIRQVAANFQYGDKAQTLLFRADSTGDKTFAAKRNGRDSVAYSVQYVYDFLRDRAIDTDRFQYVLPPETHTSQSLLINPTRDCGLLSVEVEPGRIHSSVKQVDVDLTYSASTGDFNASETLRMALPLEPAEPLRWQVRTAEPVEPVYRSQVTYVFDDGTVWDAPPTDEQAPLLRIDAPFSQLRSLLIRPNVIAPTVSEINLEVEYADIERDYLRSFLVKLVPPFESTELSWPIFDANLQTIRYRETTFEPGFIHEGEWLETADGSVVVGEKNSRATAVTVRLIGGTLADAGIDALLVTLEQVADDADEGRDRQELFFAASEEKVQPVNFTIPPNQSLRYRWRTQTFKQDGEIALSDWTETDVTQLIVSLRSL